jgi:hypothetical protein
LLFAVEFSQGIEEAWTSIATFVPKLIAFLLVLIIGIIIIKMIAKAINAVLERVGFDKAVERGGVKKALDKTEWDASDIVGKIVYYTLLLFVLQLAFGVWGENPASDIIASVIAYLPQVIAAILIIVIAMAIAAAAKEVIEAALGNLDYARGLAFAASAAIITVGVFAALDQLRIAPAIVTGLFYAILATIVGVTVIAVGGGGIKAMSTRWESVLRKYDEEKPRIAQEKEGAAERIKQRAQERADQAKSESGGQRAEPSKGGRPDRQSAGATSNQAR